MRPAVLIALAVVASACSSASYLDAPLAATAPSSQVVPSGRSLTAQPLLPVWEHAIDGYAGSMEMLRMGDHALLPGVSGIIDIVELRSGRQTGRINVQGFLHATPAVVGDRFYAVSLAAEITLQCHSLIDASLRWSARIEPTEGAVCAAGERVLIVSNTGKVMCFNVADSIPLWTRRLQGTFSTGPVAADSVIVVAGENGQLSGLSLRDGSVRWQHQSGAAFVAAPASDGRMVCAVNRKGRLIMVDAHSGEVRFTRDLGEPVHIAPVFSGESILIASSGGDLLWLSRGDGHEQRRVRIGKLPGAPPQTAFGGIVVMARDGTLLFVGPETEEAVELTSLKLRSATPPLLTEFGVLLVDEEGNATMFAPQTEGGDGNASK